MQKAKYILYPVLILLLLADSGFSFLQFYNTPLDFDMAGGIVPSDDVKQILESPFGFKVFSETSGYPNPNRFFSHWVMKEYFNYVPILLQNFAEAIDSVYLSCAIAKILIQLSLIYLLAFSITGIKNILNIDFLVAASLVTPFFQTNGYRNYMGIIDSFTTYTFFYAFPLALLLLYFSPLIIQLLHGAKPTHQLLISILWIPLAIVVSLSGHLNPGIVLIFSLLVVFVNFKNNYLLSKQEGFIKRAAFTIFKIPKNYWFFLLPISVFSLYSLFLARFDSINNSFHLPLIEMYSRLPLGLFFPLTQKPGFPVLLLIIAFNALFIRKKYKTDEGRKILNTFKWIGIFTLVYILLLPLGGYREHRPNILRYDTIMPITLSLIFFFGMSSLFILKKLLSRQRAWYVPIIIVVLLIFTNADKAGFYKNDCERIALRKISESRDSIVPISNDCFLLSWEKITDPNYSELNAQLLQIWRITDEKKLYYNEDDLHNSKKNRQ
ncbi:MAG: hypothetical protein K9H64_06195 [Bacteroidales bacterium]|nr:hypothetical protein [Bacteroidales bacterium]MCF8455286.1 hypothetical protein [Bacteroidales bacterium]